MKTLNMQWEVMRFFHIPEQTYQSHFMMYGFKGITQKSLAKSRNKVLFLSKFILFGKA